MALLKSIDNVPGIDYYDYRDNQYYNKYDYRVRVKIPCIRYTWYCKKPEDLDNKILGKTKGYMSIRKADLSTVIEHQDALKALINFRNDRKQNKNATLRVEHDTVAVFSNDLQDLKQLEQKIGTKYTYDYSQVQTSQYAGVKHFVGEPKHKYRVYFKSRRVSEEFPKELTALFARSPNLYPSPALQSWLKSRYNWAWRYSSAGHFIDYDDESTLSYLALMHGDMLGKKYKLEKRPTPV